MKKRKKNEYDPKIETVKCLGLINQNIIRLILTLPQNCVNSLDMHLVIQFLILFHQISDSKVQTLNFRNLKFEQIFSYIGGVDTYTLKIGIIPFNLTVLLNIHFLVSCAAYQQYFNSENPRFASIL